MTKKGVFNTFSHSENYCNDPQLSLHQRESVSFQQYIDSSMPDKINTYKKKSSISKLARFVPAFLYSPQ